MSLQPDRIGRATGRALLAAGMAALALGGAAHAQSSTLSSMQQGYNGGLSRFESPVNVSTRDANGNLVITDGVTQIGSDQSVFSKTGSTTGASDAYSGAGAIGGASAIGNNLSVNVSGNYNTVVVNSTQINNGSVSATTVLNGKVNLDGQ
jgi:holdfast attachment protein HfaA